MAGSEYFLLVRFSSKTNQSMNMENALQTFSDQSLGFALCQLRTSKAVLDGISE